VVDDHNLILLYLTVYIISNNKYVSTVGKNIDLLGPMAQPEK
jgi:hypothetical protein